MFRVINLFLYRLMSDARLRNVETTGKGSKTTHYARAPKNIYKGPGVHRAILEFDGFSRREGGSRRRGGGGGGGRSGISVRCVLVSCLRSLRRCTAPCRCWTATQELRGRGYQFMRCNIVGTRARSSSRCRREVPEDRSAGRNPVAERRVPCKIVLGVNDNSGRRIPGRLTFESKEPRLKLYAFDLNARLSCAFRLSALLPLLP